MLKLQFTRFEDGIILLFFTPFIWYFRLKTAYYKPEDSKYVFMRWKPHRCSKDIFNTYIELSLMVMSPIERYGKLWKVQGKANKAKLCWDILPMALLSQNVR